ncbi:MAG TPA: methyltransferase domain-containing protein [Pyrinomonadaceae bacterium]|nr:methyltransferase domain-containing protein [Pyrinomonadaceae bacterium]
MARKTKARYDDFAERYEGVMSPLQRWGLVGLRAEVLNQLPAGRILEIGAGTGLNFVHYPPEAHGVATEFSREMLKIARTKTRPSGVQLLQNRAEDLPFKNHAFDAAFATLVFCSVESPLKAFAELRRVVRPGGMVVLLEHVRPRGVLGPVFDLMNVFTSRLFDDHVNRRTAKLVSEAGLEVVDVKSRLLGIINLIRCRVS